jgi:trimeric autotransporter adhesin
MATIVTRAAKGSPLTHVEVDANFTNLNTDKVETSALATVATSGAYADLTGTPTAYTDAAVDTHLNTGTATTGEVLSWTGTDYDWIAAGGGGSALELYAENPVTPTAPSATGDNAVAIGFNARASGTKAVALVDGNASGLRGFAVGFNAAASGNNSIALGSASVSSDTSSVAIGQSATATANQSLALGYQATTATGNWPTAIGRSYASGADSFAAAIANNTSTYGATGANSVAIGRSAKASSSYALALGNGAIASNSRSTCIGEEGTSNGNYSVVIGGYQPNDFGINGRFVMGSLFGSTVQSSSLRLKVDTTDATPSVLRTNSNAAGTTNQVILPNSSAYAFHGTIVARQKASDGTASAAWKVEGLIRREANAASTVLVNSALTVLDNTPAWGLALTADTTNGGLKIEVTGAAATNIRWVATINTSEVTYA